MSDPWIDEWNLMTYTEKLNWWWAARRNYQSQEDFAAGKVAAEGVSCKYGLPGFLPGTRTPYSKPATTATEEVKSTEETTAVEETKATDESKAVEETKEEANSTTSTDDEKKSGTVNLIIPPGASTINVNKSNKKKKNKNKH